jgi:hypothetical protein
VQLLDAIVLRLRSITGVTRAAYIDGLPLTYSETLSAFNMPSNRPPVGAQIQVHSVRHVVSEDYLAAMGMRIVAGRVFNHGDSANSIKAVVVNRSFARQYLSDPSETRSQFCRLKWVGRVRSGRHHRRRA